MNAWKDFVTSALIGTEKGAQAVLPGSLEAIISRDGKQDETSFLTQAGALALWKKAGWKPAADTKAPVVAEPEQGRSVSGMSAGHLRAMLGGRFPRILPEWLAEASRLGLRVPPELLPTLLDRARQDRALRAGVLAAGGSRAQWLSAHNPDWVFASREEPEMWENGTREQRVVALRAVRCAQPAEARTRIESAWKTEPADTRAAFIAELAANLSNEDSNFLETALDDKSKEVRRAVVDLLARLPESPFTGRMIARAKPMLAFKVGGLLSRASLDVTLPGEPDAAAKRDGLDPKAFGQQKKLGDKAVLLVLILSAVPLRVWTDAFQQPPAALVKALEKNEFAGAIVTGWTWAALRQRDIAWAEALLDCAVPPHDEFLPKENLLALLPEDARAKRLAAGVRATGLKKADAEAWRSLASELDSFAGSWPPMLACEVLSALRHACADGIPWHLRANAEGFISHLPASMLPDALKSWPTDKEGVAALVEYIAFRHESLTALSQTQ